MTTVQVAVAYTSHLESCEFHSPPLFVRFVVFLKEEPQDIHFKTIFFLKKRKRKRKSNLCNQKGLLKHFLLSCLKILLWGATFLT